MIIGRFLYDQRTDLYSGEIRTLSLHRANVTIRPNKPATDREPDYRVTVETDAGAVELGAAWKKTSGRGQNYLSIVIDDPALPTRCDAALFPGSKPEDTASLVWTRPSARKSEPSAPERPKTQRKRARAAQPAPQG